MTTKSRGITLVIIVIMLLIIISVITYYYINLYQRKTIKMSIQNMKLSDKGRKELELSEGKRYRAYKDSAGLYTTGIGHLIRPDETYLITKVLTEKEVQDIFTKDIIKHEKIVKEKIKVDVSQGLYDALVSLAYNTGTIYKSIVDLVNEGDMEALAKRWRTTAITVNNGRTIIAGLQRRREREVNLFA
jgi:lysozyme